MKHFSRRILSAALAASLLITPATATNLGSWLQRGQMQLSNTASVTQGTFRQTGESSQNQSETVFTYTPESAVKPVVAFGATLYGRSTMDYVRALAEEQGQTVVAGVNGSFFDTATGIPLGCVVTEGLLRTSGDIPSVGFRADGSAIIGKPGITMEVTYPNGNVSNVHYNKQITKSNGIVLYSRDYDLRTKHTIPAYHVVLIPEKGTLALTDTITAQVDRIVENVDTCDIPEGGMVLAVAQQTDFAINMTERIFALQPGDTITITTTCQEEWQDVTYACGGGDMLVAQSQVQTAFTLNSAKRPAARTAVGLKEDGTLVLYTVDGLQKSSMGLTLEELAERMAELGCVTALNLDGGGSASAGATRPGESQHSLLTSPSDGALRRCANFIFLVRETKPAGNAQKLFLYPYMALALPGAKIPMTTLAVDGSFMAAKVPQNLTYSAQGGSIDKDGGFTAGTAGQAQARVRSGAMQAQSDITILSQPEAIVIQNETTGRTLYSLTVSSRNHVDLRARAGYYGLEVFGEDTLFTWEADGNIGSIDENGVFTAVQTTQDLTGTIRASFGSCTQEIAVTVRGMALRGRTLCGFEADDLALTADGVGIRAEENRILANVRYGSRSGRLDYDFGAVEAPDGYKKQVYATFAQPIRLSDEVAGLWILGDGSGNSLSLRVKAGGEMQSLWLTTLDFTGWQLRTVELPEGSKTIEGFAITQEPEGAGISSLYLDQLTVANGILEDTQAPVIGWEKTETELQLAVTEAGSGLQETWVRVDGKLQDLSWREGWAALALPEDGMYHNVVITAADTYGNLSSSHIPLDGELEQVFCDTDSHWARLSIGYLNRQGVLKGSANAQGQMAYRPDDSMTRQEFITALIRWMGADTLEYGQTQLPFVDTDKIASWAMDAMKTAYCLGLVTGSGSGGKLYANPTATITRQEAMVMIGRTQQRGYQQAELSQFPDADQVAAWAIDDIAVMVERNVISGSGGKLLPTGPVTRAQVAKMLTGLQ